MLVSINWIRDYVDLDGCDIKELINKFTLATAEVEDIYYMGRDVQKVVVGEIKTLENHPESKKLHLLTVDIGDRVVNCVCGAPNVKVGHIGLFRDPQTLEPVKYYFKMPPDIAERDVIIVDPMLATGGSACEAIGEMRKRGCKHITLMVLVAAPEGIKAVQEKFPDVDIYAGALDDHLNEHGYIVPGLGDAGDRIFGTK